MIFKRILKRIFNRKRNVIEACPEKGVFVLKDQMNDAVACELLKGMFAFSDRWPDKTITLYINSDGGSVTAGMAVYDSMRALQNPIRTVAYGSTGGISTLLLATGTRGMRGAVSNTRISIGDFFVRADAEQSDTQFSAIFSATEKVRKAFAIQAGNTEAQIQQMLGNKKWLSVEKAIQVGLIDRCVEE